MNNYLRHILLPAVTGFAIFVATCLWNGSTVPVMPEGIAWDKLVHFGLFFVLSAVCFWDYYRLKDGNPRPVRWMLWCFALPVLYGGIVELMQKYFFTSRSAEWGDFIADLLGSLAAMCVALILYARKRRIS